MNHFTPLLLALFVTFTSFAQDETTTAEIKEGANGYNTVRPYLKYRDGRVVYYDRVGYNMDFYMAYNADGTFEKVRHADVESGCLNKKQELYQFRMGNLGTYKKQMYLKEGTRNKLFVIACEDSTMILCTGMMHAFTGVRSSYATSIGGSNSMGAKTASTNEQYYLAVGQKVYPISFSSEDVQLWKDNFKHCPSMLEAFKIYDEKNDSSQQGINALMNALGDAYYFDCYVQFED